MFRTRETRLGLGALCTPGTAVSTRPVIVAGPRLPHLGGQPLSPPGMVAQLPAAISGSVVHYRSLVYMSRDAVPPPGSEGTANYSRRI